MHSPALPRHRAATATRSLHGGTPTTRTRDASPVPGRMVGWYRYDRHSGSWWWSPEMFVVHGLPPETTEPTTELLLQNLHPEDRSRTLQAITHACTSPTAFALEVRVCRPDGGQRSVVLLGEPDGDTSTGDVRAVEGMCVDITDCRPPGSEGEQVHALQTEVSQMRAAMASRASIEQAKGILMLLTSCSDAVAFELLAHISSHTHRKVRDVALSITDSASGSTRLPDDVREILRDACPPTSPMH